MEFLGIRAAARVLALNASTVSRYVEKHPELNHGGDRPKVDIAELREHRARNVNGAMSGNHAGLLMGEDMADSDRALAEDPGVSERQKVSLTRARTIREAAKAREATLDLEERLGNTVDRREVEDVAFEAGQMLREHLAARNRRLGEMTAAMDDPREIAALLDAEDRTLLENIADAINQKLNPDAARAA